jgi:hypothetical protein
MYFGSKDGHQMPVSKFQKKKSFTKFHCTPKTPRDKAFSARFSKLQTRSKSCG